MKILAVSDMVVDRLYSVPIPGQFGDVDLILGCGDLPYEYLEFLATLINAPVLYVPGNHDPQYDSEKPVAQAEGCEHLDLKIKTLKGMNLVGLGGSIRYRPLPPNQYTQSEMYLRVLSIIPKLLIQKARTGGNLDIMITHSPPYGINDDDDPAHQGFFAFRDVIKFFKPRFFLHGHTLNYKGNLVSTDVRIGSTTVINVNPYRLIEV